MTTKLPVVSVCVSPGPVYTNWHYNNGLLFLRPRIHCCLLRPNCSRLEVFMRAVSVTRAHHCCGFPDPQHWPQASIQLPGEGIMLHCFYNSQSVC